MMTLIKVNFKQYRAMIRKIDVVHVFHSDNPGGDLVADRLIVKPPAAIKLSPRRCGGPPRMADLVRMQVAKRIDET